ncbi:MAG: RNA methyltransferase, TrmA family, partial [Pelotomaculum thermopropionicum]
MIEKKLPLRKAEKIELLIDGISHAGEGVGRCNGMTVFVPFAVPGEAVR